MPAHVCLLKMWPTSTLCCRHPAPAVHVYAALCLAKLSVQRSLPLQDTRTGFLSESAPTANPVDPISRFLCCPAVGTQFMYGYTPQTLVTTRFCTRCRSSRLHDMLSAVLRRLQALRRLRVLHRLQGRRRGCHHLFSKLCYARLSLTAHTFFVLTLGRLEPQPVPAIHLPVPTCLHLPCVACSIWS